MSLRAVRLGVVLALSERAWRFGDADYDMPPDLWQGQAEEEPAYRRSERSSRCL